MVHACNSSMSLSKVPDSLLYYHYEVGMIVNSRFSEEIKALKG